MRACPLVVARRGATRRAPARESSRARARATSTSRSARVEFLSRDDALRHEPAPPGELALGVTEDRGGLVRGGFASRRSSARAPLISRRSSASATATEARAEATRAGVVLVGEPRETWPGATASPSSTSSSWRRPGDLRGHVDFFRDGFDTARRGHERPGTATRSAVTACLTGRPVTFAGHWRRCATDEQASTAERATSEDGEDEGAGASWGRPLSGVVSGRGRCSPGPTRAAGRLRCARRGRA